MVKKYPVLTAEQQEASPSSAVIQQILNYSKALEVKRIKNKNTLVVLN